MSDDAKDAVSRTMSAINECWLQGRPQDLAEWFAEDVVMVFPGFAGRAVGREAMVAGFRDMCDNARVIEFEERDRQVDVSGATAVVSFAFDMRYEREGGVFQSTGRDLWVMRRAGTDRWVAVWRTMVDVAEVAVG